MKKFFALVTVAFILASCVVSEQTNYKRNRGNLARFSSNMMNSSIEVTLRNLRSYMGINGDGFKCIGAVDKYVHPEITKVGDNAWASVYDSPNLEFTVSVRRENPDSYAEKWIFSGLDLKYEEGDGLGFSLVTEHDVIYEWKKSGSQLSTTYDLVPSGALKAMFYKDGKALDWCNFSYICGDFAASTGSVSK